MHYGKCRSGLLAISQLPKPLFQSEAKCKSIDFFLLTQITLVFALSFVLKVSFWKLGNGILRPLGFKNLNKKRKTKGLLAFGSSFVTAIEKAVLRP